MRRKRSATQGPAKEPRPREIHEASSAKLPEIAGCPDCGASYREGRWTWKTAPADAYGRICPACERIANGYPAGVLTVQGDFVGPNRDELIGLLRNIEDRERTEHPLKRIMSIEDEGSGFVVTVTDAKLVVSLGRALKKAYAGDLEQPPTTADKENLVRVRWARD